MRRELRQRLRRRPLAQGVEIDMKTPAQNAIEALGYIE